MIDEGVVLSQAGEQYHTVQGVGANDLLDLHARQITKQHGRRAHQNFAQRHRRELKRQAACLVNAALDELGQNAKMPIAGREF